MHHRIIKKIRNFSLAFICFLCMPCIYLYADNAEKVEDYLNNLFLSGALVDPSGDLTNILFYLDSLDPAAANAAFIQLQPSWYADLDWSTENSIVNASKIIGNNILARLREYKNCSDYCFDDCVPYRNFWVAAMGGHLQQHSLQELPAFHSNDWGAISGLDFVLAKWLSLGISAGYTHSQLEWDDLRGSNSIDNFYVGPYFVWSCGCWALDGSLLKGSHQYHSRRHLSFGFVNRRTRNTHYGDSILGHLELTRNWCWNIFSLTPYLSADYVYIHVNSIKEKGANNLDLKIKSHCTEFFQGEVGAAFSGSYYAGNALIVPTVKAGFQNITPIMGTKLKAKLQTQPGHFTVKTTNEPIYQWTTGLFVNIYVQDCPEFSFSYNGAWGKHRREYCFTGEVDWSF